MVVEETMKLQETALEMLRCPICRSDLALAGDRLDCANSACKGTFPIIDGVPILLNESNSLFSIADFTSHKATTYAAFGSGSRVTRPLRRMLPNIGHNIKTKANYEQFARLLVEGNHNPRVLVIGGSILGAGMDILLGYPTIELVETDVSLDRRTMLICDAHDLPFAAGSFDGVIIQAVLEHVIDPYRCVEEVYRVLKENGLVYAETPFMQQVHMGKFDFTRFTDLGHRRLFRRFAEIDSGMVGGPGMALAWAYRYFLLSFAQTKRARALASGLARMSSFWLKYFDYYLADKPGAFDAASGYYFMGRKVAGAVPDRELIARYRGAFR
jgi:uncharacterized protein YbaR (Trm112 family)